MIERSSIDSVIDVARVEEVIGEFVSLKKSGSGFKGLCPFHNEKTPSFSVNPVKGIYKCFGCGRAGNVVSFMMDHEQMNFVEAIRFLAARYNVDLKETISSAEEIESQNAREQLFLINQFAADFFHKNLLETEDGKAIGLTYMKERGFTDASIEKFQMGYAVNEWDGLLKAAKSAGHKESYLLEAGLAKQKDDKMFDMFRDRIMFPIHSITGRVIAFGGRTLVKDKGPKYLNSPETPVYHKSKVLYGIYQAKKSIAKEGNCFLVEGYTDVVSLVQSGIENVVASSGTALTVDQVRLIGRFSNKITVLFDGDAAGIKAAMRGIDIILEQGLEVKVVAFADGEDPDSYAKSHSDSELKDFLTKNSVDFIQFKTSLLLEDVAGDPVGRANVIRNILESIAVIPDEIVRSTTIRHTSGMLEIEEQVLYSELLKMRRNQFKKHYNDPAIDNVLEETVAHPQPVIDDGTYHRERGLIELLMKYGDRQLEVDLLEGKIRFDHEVAPENPDTIELKAYVVSELLKEDIKFTDPMFTMIFDQFAAWVDAGVAYDEKFWIHHEDKTVREFTIDVLTENYKLSVEWEARFIFVPTPEGRLAQDVRSVLYTFKHEMILDMLSETLEKIKECDEANETMMVSLVEEFKLLKGIEQDIADKLNIYVPRKSARPN